jgi:hypothetical protein
MVFGEELGSAGLPIELLVPRQRLEEVPKPPLAFVKPLGHVFHGQELPHLPLLPEDVGGFAALHEG